MIEKISELKSSCTCKNLENKSVKSDCGGGGGEVNAWWNHVNEFQTQAISPQDQVACSVSSSWPLHSSHTARSVIWRRWRLVMVGNALWHTLDNVLKCILDIFLCGLYLNITILNLYNEAMICISPYYLSLYNFLNKMSFIACNFLLSGNQVKKMSLQKSVREWRPN